MAYPRPAGYTGVGHDGGIVRNFDGRLGININTSGVQASDFNWRENEKTTFDDSDIGSYGPAE